MAFQSSNLRFLLYLFIVGLFPVRAAHAQWMTVMERYPAGSIHSEERADQALKDIELERRAIDARFAKSERACYDKFFATDCLQKAKDLRRDALARMRSIEIEANTFKRRSRAEEREKAAAERTAKREAQANERVQASMPVPSDDNDTK